MATDSMVLCSSHLTRKSRQLLLMLFLTEKTRVWKYADVISSIFRNLCCTNKQCNSGCSETRFLYQLSVWIQSHLFLCFQSTCWMISKEPTKLFENLPAVGSVYILSYVSGSSILSEVSGQPDKWDLLIWLCGIPLQNSQCWWAF